MAAPRNYLYHLITRVARCRAEPRRADDGNGRGRLAPCVGRAIAHASLYRASMRGIRHTLLSFERYRAADNEDDVRTYVRTYLEEIRVDGNEIVLLRSLSLLVLSFRDCHDAGKCRKLNLCVFISGRECRFRGNGTRLKKASTLELPK